MGFFHWCLAGVGWVFLRRFSVVMHPVFWLRETDFSWISFFVFVYLFILPMLVNGFRLKASAVPCPGCMGGNKETQELITMLFLECQSS